MKNNEELHPAKKLVMMGENFRNGIFDWQKFYKYYAENHIAEQREMRAKLETKKGAKKNA